MIENVDPLLSPAEAAQKLNVTERQLLRWRVEGGGPQYVRLGHRTIRYANRSLQTFVADQSRRTTSDAAA